MKRFGERVLTCYYPYYYPYSRVTTLTPQITPSRCRALAPAIRVACRFQIGEQGANPFPAHAGTGLFDVDKTELAGLLADRREYQPGFRTARGFDLTGAPLEFAIGAAGDREKVIEPGEEVVLAFVPALGALLEDVIVVVFPFFDEPLQANVPAHFVSVLVERQQREQAGDAAIAVTERVDAKEIEHECPDGHERRNLVLVDGVAIDEAEFIHGSWRGFGGDARETHDGRGAWPQFDDVVVHFLELTGIAAAFLTELMETAQQVGSDGQGFRLRCG